MFSLRLVITDECSLRVHLSLDNWVKLFSALLPDGFALILLFDRREFESPPFTYSPEIHYHRFLFKTSDHLPGDAK